LEVTQGAGLYPPKDRGKDTPIYDGKTPARGDQPDPAASAPCPSLRGPRPNLIHQTWRNRMFGSRGPHRPTTHTGETSKGAARVHKPARIPLKSARFPFDRAPPDRSGAGRPPHANPSRHTCSPRRGSCTSPCL
jgi:hypothetical protein